MTLLYRGTLAVDTFFFLAAFVLAVVPSRGSLGTAIVSRMVR